MLIISRFLFSPPYCLVIGGVFTFYLGFHGVIEKTTDVFNKIIIFSNMFPGLF